MAERIDDVESDVPSQDFLKKSNTSETSLEESPQRSPSNALTGPNNLLGSPRGGEKVMNSLGITGRTLATAVQQLPQCPSTVKGKFWLYNVALTQFDNLAGSLTDIKFKIWLGRKTKYCSKLVSKNLDWSPEWSMKCNYSDTLRFVFTREKNVANEDIGFCELTLSTILIPQGLEKSFNLLNQRREEVPGIAVFIRCLFVESKQSVSGGWGNSRSSISEVASDPHPPPSRSTSVSSVSQRVPSNSSLNSSMNSQNGQSRCESSCNSQDSSHSQGAQPKRSKKPSLQRRNTAPFFTFSPSLRLTPPAPPVSPRSQKRFKIMQVLSRFASQSQVHMPTSALAPSDQSHDFHHPHNQDNGGLSANSLHQNNGPLSQLPDQTQKIPLEDLEFVKPLGAGGSGYVECRKWHGTEVALKQFRTEIASSGPGQELLFETPQAFLNEIEALRKLRHPNIVTLYGYTMSPQEWGIVVEYVRNGSLEDVMKVEESRKKIHPVQGKILIDIARGLNYLHGKQIIHRDMKPGNILVRSLDPESEVSVVLCDFGISKQAHDFQVNTIGRGTPKYMAPEQYQSSDYTTKVDIYSFALIMWELVSGRNAFNKYTFKFELKRAVCDKQERPRIPAWFQPQLSYLIQRAWSPNPEDRPESHSILVDLCEIFQTSHSVISRNVSSTPSSPTTLTTTSSSLNYPPNNQAVTSIPAQKVSIAQNFWVSNPNHQTNFVIDYVTHAPVSWTDFADFLARTFGIDEQRLGPLHRVLIDERGEVTLARVKRLLDWFCPLLPEKVNYTCNEDDDDADHPKKKELIYEDTELEDEDEFPDPTLFDPQNPGCTLSSLCSFLSRDWFHGFISFQDSISRLENQRVGTFLVRFSERKPGSYALAVVTDKAQVQQFQVTPCIGGGFKFKGEVVVKCIPELITRYRTTHITKATCLVDTIPPPPFVPPRNIAL